MTQAVVFYYSNKTWTGPTWKDGVCLCNIQTETWLWPNYSLTKTIPSLGFPLVLNIMRGMSQLGLANYMKLTWHAN